MQRLLSRRFFAVAFALLLAARALHAAANEGIPQDNLSAVLLQSRIGAEVDGAWFYSTDYPSPQKTERLFQDKLGTGTLLTIRYSGRSGAPDLIREMKHYQNHAFNSVLVHVENTTAREIHISRIRMFEGEGKTIASLGGPLAKTRVLSDSYSEDTPVVRIRDFDDMPKYGVHFAIGSQLLFNRDSGRSFFAAALTSRHWLTAFHLTSESFSIDDEGTTEITTYKSLSPSRPQDHILLKISATPGSRVDSEELLVSEGKDYLQDLQSYGAAVRVLNDARVTTKAPWGWWSYTAYYRGVSEGLVDTTAKWQVAHLLKSGYDYLHIDEGYGPARGEYINGDPVRFPNGMEDLAREVTRSGLTFGLWTAPFEVSDRTWVYKNHKEWLVTNDQGEPISLGGDLYALDPTNPGAQDYLRKTYSTMAHVWGVGYIKMDFMEASAVEGHHYRPDTSAIEALRIGLKIIRESVGDNVILDKDGSPMLTPVGIVDTGRLSNDTEHSFKGTFDAATGIAARFYMNHNFYIADPDVFCVSNYRSQDPRWGELEPVTMEEAKAAITLSAMAGGMFEDGDDLPALGNEPDRLALLTNPDLLKLMRLSRSATPLDLMSYIPEDRQPSLFWVRESHRQGMLAVFNWSESSRTHDISLEKLGISGNRWQSAEVFSASGVTMTSSGIHIEQPSHSVRLIRLVDNSLPAAAPEITIRSDSAAQVGQTVSFQIERSSSANPLLTYEWNFGDGTSSNGEQARHTFTHPGSYQVSVDMETLDGVKAHAVQLVTVDGQLKTR